MSNPSPPKSNKLVVSQATKLKVFISYSREDLKFADQLDAALDLCNFDSVIDRHSISGGEDWKRRLGGLIRDADTIVFVLSPASARSEICAWEVEEASRLGKRVLPVLCCPLDSTSPPPLLQDLNYIYFYDEPNSPGSGFGSGLKRLVTALNTDLDWLREHTRLLQRAMEWDVGNRPTNRLLSGSDIAEAKAWAARRAQGAPEPTPLHLDFIRASEEEEAARSSAQRKQLELMAAAQSEREAALNQAEEALKQAADAQRKRSKIRNFAFAAVTIVALLAGWQWWKAEKAMEVALSERAAKEEHQLQLAVGRLADATDTLDLFFKKAEMRIDTIWRHCSRRDGVVSRWLAKVGANSTSSEQEELVRQLNTVFVPLIDADPYVSSMMIVGPRGFEYVALDERVLSESQEKGFILRGKRMQLGSEEGDRYKYTWRNRLMWFDDWKWAREWYWQDDDAHELKGVNPHFELEPLVTEIDGKPREIAYDPRYRRYARPWMREADDARISSELWAPQEPFIHWTPPYIFFTRKVPGVTASRGWRDANGKKYVVAVDFTLIALSLLTTQLRLHESGMVFMFDTNGTVISLPHGIDKFGHNDTGNEELTKKIEQFFSELLDRAGGVRPDEVPKALEVRRVDASLGTNVLEPAFKAWKEKAFNERKATRVDFAVGDESWTGLFESVSYPHGDRSVRIAVIAPTKELGIEQASKHASKNGK